MKKPTLNDYVFAGKLIGHAGKTVSTSALKYNYTDINAVLSILKNNKVPLVNLEKDLFEIYPDFFDTPDFKDQYEIEYAEHNHLKREWIKVREKFVKVGIETMLIKSVGFFPYKSSNLDVLIKQSKRELAESILKEMGYIQLHNVEEPYKTLFRIFKGGKPTSVIHLHTKVAWINPFHEEELLWAHYRKSDKDDLLDIPSPEDSILILTAHWFYEDKEIKLSDIINSTTCLENCLDWNYITAVAKKLGWLNGLYFGLLVHSFVEKNLYGKSMIQDGLLEKFNVALPVWLRTYLEKKVFSREISLPFKLPKIFGKFLHFAKTLKDDTLVPSRKIYEMYKVAYASLFVVLFYMFKVNIRYQPAMLISISGVDGSGKSTYAQHLYDMLNFCEIRTRIVWSRVGSSNFLKPFSKVAKIFYYLKKGKGISNHSENYRESEARRKDLFVKSPVFKLVGVSLLLLEMLWRYFFKVALPIFLKKAVICDRYIFDTLVDIKTRYGIDLNTKEGRLFKKILTTLTPKPDVAYVLLVPFEEACSRENVDVKASDLVMDQISSYKEITKLFNLHQINTGNNTSVEDISDKMIYETLTRYYHKWPARKSHFN